MDISLIRKYNVPGPRYTSYPTVPFWNEKGIALQDWKDSILKSFSESKKEGISIYIHLPFCENLCTFCGCHKRITKRHEVEEPYIDALLKEWNLYLSLFPEKPIIKELHLGGGTPTFFSSDNLKKLIEAIGSSSIFPDDKEFSFEGHPNFTSREQLQTLFDLGFRRNSFGVQDYDLKVQKTINRIQPFENVKRVHDWSREIGYTSISHDLVFGLPFQTKESIAKTIELTNQLRPDRIAYYSYAHVPWIKGVGQRGYDENDLPKDEVKRELYEIGKELFDKNGYIEIGMDHFSLPSDSLNVAMSEGKLHRNFMGYTTTNTQLMVGLGMSAISDSWYAFAQNEKSVEDYQERVNKGELPIFRGHLLSENDLLFRRKILDLMCKFETTLDGIDTENKESIITQLKDLIEDGIVSIESNRVFVSEFGKPFVRNVCMAFDQYLPQGAKLSNMFSKTV